MSTTGIYTLSLHDALPICQLGPIVLGRRALAYVPTGERAARASSLLPGSVAAAADRIHHRSPRDLREGRKGRSLQDGDRKSTRLNSSHTVISYAVFCLKKK